MVKKRTVYDILVKTAVIVVIAVIFISIHWVIPDFYSTLWHLTWRGDVDGLSAYVSSFGYGAWAISVFMIALCNVTGLPSIPFLTVNGVIFGLGPGLIVSWLGEVIGVELSFLIMRTIFHESTQQFIERRGLTAKVKSYSTLRNMIMLRSIPYSPNVVITAIAAVSAVTMRHHFIATIIGKVPSVGIEVWLGHDLLNFAEHGARFCVLAIVTIVVCYLYRRYRNGK